MGNSTTADGERWGYQPPKYLNLDLHRGRAREWLAYIEQVLDEQVESTIKDLLKGAVLMANHHRPTRTSALMPTGIRLSLGHDEDLDKSWTFEELLAEIVDDSSFDVGRRDWWVSQFEHALEKLRAVQIDPPPYPDGQG